MQQVVDDQYPSRWQRLADASAARLEVRAERPLCPLVERVSSPGSHAGPYVGAAAPGGRRGEAASAGGAVADLALRLSDYRIVTAAAAGMATRKWDHLSSWRPVSHEGHRPSRGHNYFIT